MKKKFIGKAVKNTKQEFQQEMEGLVGKKEYENFKKFAFKGDMIKMSIAFILGASFNNVVKGMTDFVIMPILKYSLDQTGSDWRTYKVELTEGLAIEFGQFAGTFVDFILISIILYIVYIKMMKPLITEEVKTTHKITCKETKVCKSCFSEINWQAVRCPECTSFQELNE